MELARSIIQGMSLQVVQLFLEMMMITTLSAAFRHLFQ
jgi:hypothetical protein